MKAVPDDDVELLKCIDSVRSTTNYSPPPLFANVPTTVTLEDLAAAAGENSNLGRKDDSREDEVGKSWSGNAEDFVIASKRKRRIEIPRSQSAQVALERTAPAAAPTPNSMNMNATEKDSYLKSFCAGGVEFVAKKRNNGADYTDEDGAQKCGGASLLINCNGREEQGSREEKEESEAHNPKEDQNNRREVLSVSELVGGKIGFLSEGRPAVSGVQAMAIEFEVGCVLFCLWIQFWRLNGQFQIQAIVTLHLHHCRL